MKKLCGLFCTLLMALAVFMPMSKGECYVTLDYKEVPLAFGKLKIPAEMSVVELDVLSFVKEFETNKQMQRDIELLKHQEQYKFFVKVFEALKNPTVRKNLETLRFYQGGLFDGKSYHTVFFVTIKDNENLQNLYGGFFSGKINDQKKALVQKQIEITRLFAAPYLLPAGEKIDITTVRSVSSANQFDLPVFELFELSDANFADIKGKHGFTNDLRFAGDMMGSFVSAYVKQYTFSLKNKPAQLIFISIDSEREFWQQIFDKAMLDKKQA